MSRDKGKSFDFFEKVTVTNTSFSDEADVTFNIKYLKSFSLMNEGDNTVEYSFNGNQVHGDLTPGKPSEAIFFDNRPISQVWFRTTSGSNVIRVEAWGY